MKTKKRMIGIILAVVGASFWGLAEQYQIIYLDLGISMLTGMLPLDYYLVV